MESMTSKQVREYLQVGKDAVRSLIRKDMLHPVKVGNRLLFVADEVRALLNSNRGEAK
ncbi:MAG: Helix-turn-helix domain [Cyanobacteriota bacterium erpe_2018_sw_21hr_WHONDRS-SW48-000092_B_bin.40]|jgi:excisionase family DNA binding protein|nr:Helix-turn-helix domain [Cyanobacteriota bacterium erpe_2018_sw_21hr_WHONDRS-SW48-000092_B_bin.40]